MLSSANLKEVSVKTGKDQATNGRAYVITRNQSGLIPKIMNDIQTKKVYPKAELVVTLKNGKQIIHDLNQVILSNYSSTNQTGKTTKEEFYLQFSADVMRPIK